MNRKERRAALAGAQPASVPKVDPTVARDYQVAVEYLREGKLAQSEEAHRRVLAKSPRHAPTLHHLGLIAFKRDAEAEAVDYIRQSLDIDPDYHQAWLNLAVILGELRRADEAIDACRRSVALQPNNAEPYRVLGNLLRIAENNSEAAAAYVRSLSLKPDQPAVLARLADVTLQSGKADEALALCKQALEIEPENAEAQAIERRIIARSQPLESAAAVLERRAKTLAEKVHGLNELGNVLRAERRYEEAVDVYHRAIQADPSHASTLFNLALAYEGLGRGDDALASYQAGLAIDPDRAEAYANVGSLLRGMNMHAGAIQAFEYAIKLDPDLATAHYNLAVVLKQQQRFEEARIAFRKSVECAPDSIVNRFEFANMRRVLCDWDGIEADERRSLELFRKTATGIAPFLLISMTGATRADQLAAGRRFAKTFSVPEALRFRSYLNRSGDGERVRLGFLSSDFFEHATAMLLVEVLENIDRSRFELFAYCFSPDDGSALRRRIVRTFDHYTDVTRLSHRDAARTIHADGIDILIDLKGYTKDTRSEILAYRPAPIQVNYLGYPATMGADFVDYLLADAVVAPMEHQPHYSERIVHLPNSYQPNDRQRQISAEPMTRAEFGLPDNAFVFCSFNNSYKLNAAMFDIWMPLLQSVPNSVLWLLTPNDLCSENLRREATARGVGPGRLVFAKRESVPRHLARHRLADLFLDALPCNAHTTASDALWAGLPVLTCVGDTFSGRVAASLLKAMDLDELITTSLEDYAKAALTLARDKEKRDAVRLKLWAARETGPLFDSKRYTRNLERSFETMVRVMRSGEPPRPFAVAEATP